MNRRCGGKNSLCPRVLVGKVPVNSYATPLRGAQAVYFSQG
jgi:hypothetical protein